MNRLLPGSRVLILFCGIFTMLTVQHQAILVATGGIFLICNIYTRKIRWLLAKKYLLGPFFLSAVLLGLLHGAGGWQFSGMLCLKFLTIVFWNSLWLADFPDYQLTRGLRQLRVPQVITVTIFFIFRYLDVFKEELADLARARHMRGARMGRRKWFSLAEYRIWGEVIGAGLVRSIDRADRVYQAMRLRGLKASTLVTGNERLTQNSGAIILCTVLMVALVWIDRGGMLQW